MYIFLLDWRQAVYNILLVVLAVTAFITIPSTHSSVASAWWVDQESAIAYRSKTVYRKRLLPKFFYRRLSNFLRLRAVLLSVIIQVAFTFTVFQLIYHQAILYLPLLLFLCLISKKLIKYVLPHPFAPPILSFIRTCLKKHRETSARRTLQSIEQLKSEELVTNQPVEVEASALERDDRTPKLEEVLEEVDNFSLEEEMTSSQREKLTGQLEQIKGICFTHGISAELEETLSECVKNMVREVIIVALIAEFDDQLGFSRYERTGEAKASHLHRCGSFPRTLRTVWGEINIRVPKTRNGNKGRAWKILERYERSFGPWLDLQLHLYTLGLSQRDMQEVLHIGFGQILSQRVIERIVNKVREEKEEFLGQPLKKSYPAVVIDGINTKIMCCTGKTKRNRIGQERAEKEKKGKVILAAIGVLADGGYEILYFEVVDLETTESWKGFFEKLKEKGLNGEETKLIVSDGRLGIGKAMKKVFSKEIKHQRCIFHKLKNLGDNLEHKGIEIEEGASPKEIKSAKTERAREVLSDAKKIYQQRSIEKSKEEIESFKKKWEVLEGKAVRCFEKDIDLTLNYLRVDFIHKSRIRTTNLLERFFEEFRRKSNEVRCFGSQEQAKVLFYLIVRRERAKRMTGKGFL